MIEREPEIAALDAVVVLIAYDRPGLLGTKMMRGLSVPWTILFDPDRLGYRAWGLGRTNLLGAMLSPELNWRYLKLLLKGERFLGFAPDMFQLGGDFILDRSHQIRFLHRMRNNGDRPPVESLVDALREVAARGP